MMKSALLCRHFPTSVQFAPRLPLFILTFSFMRTVRSFNSRRVRHFDPGSRGRCVNSSITGDASPATAQQSAERLIHLSLQPLAAPRSTESAPEWVHSREQESRSSQDSPRLSWAVTPDRSGLQGQEALAERGDNGAWCVCFSFSPLLECAGVELSASLCETLQPI